MAARDVEYHFDNIPDVVIRNMVKLLPLSDRKTLSLMSTRWNSHAFSFSSMKDVKLRIPKVETENQELGWLDNTERSYRHLCYSSSRPCTENDMARILRVLTKLGPKIESFSLHSKCTPTQFEEMILKLPKLKLLELNVHGAWDQRIQLPRIEEMTHLNELRLYNNLQFERWLTETRVAPNIVKLFVDVKDRIDEQDYFLNFIRLYDHQLVSFELNAPNARISYHELSLRMLRTLDMTGVYTDESQLCTFFRNLPLLQVVRLNFCISVEALRVVCSRCTNVYKLELNVSSLDGDGFSQLARLALLTDLHIINYLTHELIENCLPLATVENLCLTQNPVQSGVSIERLNQLFPRLHNLKIDVTYMTMSDQFMHGVSSHFSQITCLSIVSRFNCGSSTVEYATPQLFFSVMQLSNLEELTLSCMRWSLMPQDRCLYTYFLRTDFSQFSIRPHRNLKRLKLNNCSRPTGGILIDVAPTFPSLVLLEVKECEAITTEDVDRFRQTMPACVVHYDRWRVGE